MREENDSFDAVSKAVRVVRIGRRAELALSNGIVLGLKSVPPLMLSAVNGMFVQPPPPKYMNDEKGREEENPNDPEYLRKCQDVANAQDRALNNLVFAVGTEFKSAPEGYFGPDDDGWIESVEFANQIAGVELNIDRDDRIKRYLAWLRFYALENSTDVALVAGLPMQLTGVSEDEVESVIESFRGIPVQRTNNQSQPQELHPNGDSTAGSDGRSDT